MKTKKVVRLTETELVNLVKKVIKEQVDTNPRECAKRYIDFIFTPSVVDSNGVVVDGGDLQLWNNNEIPQRGDSEAYRRFLTHLKESMDDPLYDEGECENVTFEDVKPFIESLYLEKVDSLTMTNLLKKIKPTQEEIPLKIRRRIEHEGLKDTIQKLMAEYDPNEFSDEFEYADNILQWAVDDVMSGIDVDSDLGFELMNFIRQYYTDEIFEYYYDKVEDSDF
jgi:hypothetical protein